jgi:hypothetical protein
MIDASSASAVEISINPIMEDKYSRPDDHKMNDGQSGEATT